MKRFLLTPALVATIATLGYTSVSLAGEGGIAGAAAFKLDATTGNFTEFAAASAIGKTSALAGSSISGVTGGLDAFALGTGGSISYSSSNQAASNSSYYYYYNTPAYESHSLSAGTDYDLGQAQANAIDATSIPSVPLPPSVP